MSDLISREEAIEALMRAEALACAFGYHNVIGTIRELPTIDPVKWTPVTERLPEKTGHYLVTAIEDGKRSVYSDDYFVYGWDDLGDEVVAWAELPEPWRGEEDETD